MTRLRRVGKESRLRAELLGIARKYRQETCNCERLLVRVGGVNPAFCLRGGLPIGTSEAST